jgi:hypothetical protein
MINIIDEFAKSYFWALAFADSYAAYSYLSCFLEKE